MRRSGTRGTMAGLTPSRKARSYSASSRDFISRMGLAAWEQYSNQLQSER